MKNHTLLMSIFILMLIGCGTAFCNEDGRFVETIGKGNINWSNGLVRAVGIGVPPSWAYGKPQSRPLALTAARMAAYRNLLKVVQGIRIDSKKTVNKFILSDGSIHAQVDSIIRSAEVIKIVYHLDGTVEATVQMSLTGGFSQLIMPVEIQHVEPVKITSSIENFIESKSNSNPDVFTGLVVDARGLNIKPVIAPKIFNENRKEVYGPAYVSREHAVQQGMCRYFSDIDKAIADKRLGDNPLVVKGIKKKAHENSDIIISNADASVLKSTPENLSFLRKCRVIIIVD